MTIRQARMSKGMTQKYVVQMMNLKGFPITTSGYSLKENGKRAFWAKELIYLSKLFDVDPRDIELP